jgi:hypothetical protein
LAVECLGELAKGSARIGNDYASCAIDLLLADNSQGAALDSFADKLMAIEVRAHHGYEYTARCNVSRVANQIGNYRLGF